jgi:hypothetical protein
LRRSSVWHGRLGALAALAGALAARPALAQVPTGAALSPASHSPKAGPLTVWVDAPGAELDPTKLQAALSRELGRDVVLTNTAAEAAVQIHVEAARAKVHYATDGGERLDRSVELPPDRQRSLEVVSWLTVNLVRDEASELLGELRARRKEEADARAAAEKVAADRAAADQASADKAATDKAAAEKAAADEAARKKAEQARNAANDAGGPPKKKENEDLLREPLRSFDLALVTPLSLIHDSKRRELKLQLSLLYGESGGMRGAALGLGVVRVRRYVEGMAHGVAAVLVGGDVRGAVASVGYSEVAGNLDGALLGAGAAWHRGKQARGALIAAGGALAGELEGVAIGGGFITTRSLDGAGIAGGATVIRGPSSGALLAGGVNITADHRGSMVAGGVNVARDLNGIALAPINVARRVRGLQIGVVNVADEVDGAAIGVLSFAKNGHFQPVIWGAADGSAHVALKSTVGWAFTQLGAGINLGENTFSYDGGAGLHLKLGSTFYLEPGVHYSGHHDTADASGSLEEHQLHYLAQGGLRVGDKLDFLVGAGVRHTIAGGSGAAVAPEFRGGIAFF